ncbi:MAG TPA: peptidoglycan-binding protein [Thermosynechococcaceae cyanobacterium]
MGRRRGRTWRQVWLGGMVVGWLAVSGGGVAQSQVPGATTNPSSEVTRPLLRSGSQGAEVRELQATLKLLGYYTGGVDGVYGKDTIAGVIQFQQAAGLPTDGVTGAATWNRLFPAIAEPDTATRPPTPFPPPSSTDPKPTVPDSATLPILRQGMKGTAVAALQARLRTIGFLKGSADGVFGAETLAAVRAAQRNFGLEPDGVVGAATWSALLGSSR